MLEHETADPPRRRKTSEIVARTIADEILSGNLSEGAKLPSEREMVERFEVARGTVREALRLLETRGVLTIRPGPGGGPVVRRPRPSDLSEALTLLLQFQGGSLRDVIQARHALEPTATRLAATRMGEDAIAALAETVELMRVGVDDEEMFLRQNARFHQLIARASGNPVLQTFLESLGSIADGSVLGVRYSARTKHDVIAAHSKIVKALGAGDPDQAEAAMLDHLEEAGTFWARRYPDLMKRAVEWTT